MTAISERFDVEAERRRLGVMIAGSYGGPSERAGGPQAALYGLILRIALVPFESRASSRS
jgi:hypothetical protein